MTHIPPQRQRDPASFDITGRELADYIHAHCPTITCPACGDTRQPSVDAPDLESPAFLAGMQLLAPVTHGYRGFCSATCQGCGYAWQFDSSRVIGWVLDNRQGGRQDG